METASSNHDQVVGEPRGGDAPAKASVPAEFASRPVFWAIDPAVTAALGVLLIGLGLGGQAFGERGWPLRLTASAFVLGMALEAVALLQFAARLRHWASGLKADAESSRLALDRLAALLEKLADRPLGSLAAESSSGIDRRMQEFDQALREADWARASGLLDALELERPGDPALERHRTRFHDCRRESARNLRDQLEAARAVGDSDRVLELHGLLVAVLDADDRSAHERELSHWFLQRIQKRLLSGKIQPEVVRLAGQVADTFASTVSGASLKQSLPVLRKAVGLCPRCALPYTGLGQACPACLAAMSQPAGPEPSLAHHDAESPNSVDPDQ